MCLTGYKQEGVLLHVCALFYVDSNKGWGLTHHFNNTCIWETEGSANWEMGRETLGRREVCEYGMRRGTDGQKCPLLF